MSLTKSELPDPLSRNLAPVEPEYGEQCEEERPDQDEWPTEEEQRVDAERSDFD